MWGLLFRIIRNPLLLSAAIAVAGLLAFGLGWMERNDIALLTASGVDAVATIEGGMVETKGRTRRKSTTLDIRWTGANGEDLTYSLSVSSEVAGAVVVGDYLVEETLPIRYAYDGARLVVLAAADVPRRAETAEIMFNGGAIVGAVGAIALGLVAFFRFRKAQAAKSAAPAPGQFATAPQPGFTAPGAPPAPQGPHTPQGPGTT
jgi:hypothetical protein